MFFLLSIKACLWYHIFTKNARLSVSSKSYYPRIREEEGTMWEVRGPQRSTERTDIQQTGFFRSYIYIGINTYTLTQITMHAHAYTLTHTS